LKFIRDILITFSTQIIAVIFGIAVTIVTARVLGPEGKGAYSLILLVPTLLALLGNLGIGFANVYFGGKWRYSWAELSSNSLVSAVLSTLLLRGNEPDYV
jgi:O-antigen/teichoic acid export membrane protein